MKRKFIVSGMILLLSAVILALMYLVDSQNNPRIAWDDYLSEAYDKIQVDADNPDLAALQNYYMSIDPALKKIPENGAYKAYLKTREIISQKNKYQISSDLNWTEVPSNMGGRTRAILFDTNDTLGAKVWAGSVTGGLWYNNNIFDSTSIWQAVNDFWPGLSISSIVTDPNEPLTFYVGTGEYQTARQIYRESSGVGMGIWKSTDGGQTWSIIPSSEGFKYISDIKVRDENGQSVIYAGVVSGYYEGINFPGEPNDGLYRSVDGGENWQQVLPDIFGDIRPYAPADLELGPTGRIFVGSMKNSDGKGGATILYSDSGTMNTWSICNDYDSIIQNDPDLPVPGRVILACSSSDSNRVYALIGAGWLNSTNFNYARGRYILRSDNGGQSWTEMNLPGGDPDWATLSWHAFAAVVNPVDPDKLYVGGKDVWKTMNGGFSWSKVSDWTLMYSGGGDDYVHCDQHIQTYIPGSTNAMLFTTDGGVFYTNNSASGNPVFEEKNKNYCTLQYYSCAIYPSAGINYFVGGLQDNGTLLTLDDTLDIHDMIDTGDGAYCFFDETEPQLMITSTYFNVYSLFIDWEFNQQMGVDGSGVFINPADYDNENNILFANAVKFNGTYANQVLRISSIPENPNSELIGLNTGLSTWYSQLKVSPYGPDGSTTLFLGSQNGRLFKVVNAHSSPLVLELNNDSLPTGYISSISMGGSEDTLLITFSNFGIPSVWQSYDGGSNWLDISGNLPNMPVRWALYHPQNTKQVMLATEVGIWSTNNADDEDVIWEPDTSIPNVRVDMLKIRSADHTVLAATHGRGLWHATWPINQATQVNDMVQQAVRIFPNPATERIYIHSNVQIKEVMLYSCSGSRLLEQKINNTQCKINTTALKAGLYIIQISTDDGFLSKQVIVH